LAPLSIERNVSEALAVLEQAAREREVGVSSVAAWRLRVCG
jgi:hypothetical protein